MTAAGLSQAAQDAFKQNYEQLVGGGTGRGRAAHAEAAPCPCQPPRATPPPQQPCRVCWVVAGWHDSRRQVAAGRLGHDLPALPAGLPTWHRWQARRGCCPRVRSRRLGSCPRWSPWGRQLAARTSRWVPAGRQWGGRGPGSGELSARPREVCCCSRAGRVRTGGSWAAVQGCARVQCEGGGAAP